MSYQRTPMKITTPNKVRVALLWALPTPKMILGRWIRLGLSHPVSNCYEHAKCRFKFQDLSWDAKIIDCQNEDSLSLSSIEPRMVSMFWAHSPILTWQMMSLRCPFSTMRLAKYHSHIETYEEQWPLRPIYLTYRHHSDIRIQQEYNTCKLGSCVSVCLQLPVALLPRYPATPFL